MTERQKMNDPAYNWHGNLNAQLDRIEAKLDQLLARKKRKPRANKSETYPDWFEDMWQVYPKRAGSNPKSRTMNAISARLVEDKNLYNPVLSNGAERYAKFCDATGKTGTEFVMQAATFFGPDKHYENDWTIPKPQAKNGQSEIYSQSHQQADFTRDVEDGLDTSQNPYGDMK